MDSATKQRIADGQACYRAALDYLARGWSVLPLCYPDHVGIHLVSKGHLANCSMPGKRPWIRWGEYEDKLPTKSDVDYWWKQLSSSNVGVALGPVSGIIRVDVEGPAGEVALLRKSNGDLPPTLEFRSGRADGTGRGLLFGIPPGARLRSTYEKIAPNQELRFQARGAQTVLPPSRHKDGGLYEWTAGHAPGEIAIAPMPAWLLVELAEAKNGNGRSKDDWEKLFAGVPEGSRNDTMAAIIGKLMAGWADLDNVHPLWLSVLAINENNDPPLGEAELKTTFVSVHSAEKRKRLHEDSKAFDRFCAETVTQSCPKDDEGNIVSETPPRQEPPPWHVVEVDTDPIHYRLRSPFWSHCERVVGNGGYVVLTPEHLCYWSGVVKQVMVQAGERVRDRNKNWDQYLHDLLQCKGKQDAPLESRRPMLVSEFLLGHLRGARECRLEEDGQTIRFGSGSPQKLPDGRIIVGLQWLVQQASFAAESFKQKEILDAIQRAGMVKEVLGPEKQRRRWWIISPSLLGVLEGTILETTAGAQGAPSAHTLPTSAPEQNGSG